MSRLIYLTRVVLVLVLYAPKLGFAHVFVYLILSYGDIIDIYNVNAVKACISYLLEGYWWVVIIAVT